MYFINVYILCYLILQIQVNNYIVLYKNMTLKLFHFY